MLRRKLAAAALAAVTVATLAWAPAEAGQTPNGLRVTGYASTASV